MRQSTDQLQRNSVIPLLERMSMVPRPFGEAVQPCRGAVSFVPIRKSQDVFHRPKEIRKKDNNLGYRGSKNVNAYHKEIQDGRIYI